MTGMLFCSYEGIQRFIWSLGWKGAQKPSSSASSTHQKFLLLYRQQWCSSLGLYSSGDEELITLQGNLKQNISSSSQKPSGPPAKTERGLLFLNDMLKNLVSPTDSSWNLKKPMNLILNLNLNTHTGEQGGQGRASQPAATPHINWKALASAPSMTTMSSSHLLPLDHLQRWGTHFLKWEPFHF